ncbi:MAG: hypothetical protein AMXMBFR59_37760 [Rhodanobacteraceae bacterium]
MTHPSSQPSSDDSGVRAGFSAAVKAYLLVQLRAIDEQLLLSRRHPHRAVHALRKAVRRFRSVLALCGDAAPVALARIDRRVRRIGKDFSALRDAHVLVGAVAAVRRRDARPAVWQELEALAVAQRKALLGRALADDPEFRAVRRRVARISTDLARGEIGYVTGAVVARALVDSAARVTRAERKARDSARKTVQHRWRRRVRRLRLQLEGLEAIAGDPQTSVEARVEAQWILADAADRVPSAATLAVLADRLGRQQDLARLRAVVREHDELPDRALMLQALKRQLSRDGRGDARAVRRRGGVSRRS